MEERLSIDEIRKIMHYISKGYHVPDEIYQVIWDTAVREIEDKKRIVIIKRDPNVERNRIQAMYVKIIDGATIELHPAMVGGFGADFDGDQMAIFAPISKEAQDEARNKMLVAVSSTGLNSPQFKIDKEAYTGIFTLTTEYNDYPTDNSNTVKEIKSLKEAEALHIHTPVIFSGQKTTAGRVVFNSILPEYIPFINEPVDKKKVGAIVNKLITTNQKDFVKFIDDLLRMGNKYATIYPRTISLDMLQLTPELHALKRKLSESKDLLEQSKILDEMDDLFEKHIKENQPHLYEQIKSGAAKGKDQIRQVAVAKGLIANAKGEILPPIAKSLNEGFTPEEYFDASAGSRKGLADKAHMTAYGGYTYRKMLYALGNCTADINTGNCGTRRTLNIKLTKDLFKRMQGRYIQHPDGKIEPVSESMIGQIIPLRSPIYCKSFGICRTCYGELIKQLDSKNVGILSASECFSLSEKIMKCSNGLIGYNGMLMAMEDIIESNY